MGIQERATEDYRSQWNIPDSEGFEEAENRKRRAETGSSVAFSDSHDSKKGRLEDIEEVAVE